MGNRNYVASLRALVTPTFEASRLRPSDLIPKAMYTGSLAVFPRRIN